MVRQYAAAGGRVVWAGSAFVFFGFCAARWFMLHFFKKILFYIYRSFPGLVSPVFCSAPPGCRRCASPRRVHRRLGFYFLLAWCEHGSVIVHGVGGFLPCHISASFRTIDTVSLSLLLSESVFFSNTTVLKMMKIARLKFSLFKVRRCISSNRSLFPPSKPPRGAHDRQSAPHVARPDEICPARYNDAADAATGDTPHVRLEDSVTRQISPHISHHHHHPSIIVAVAAVCVFVIRPHT